MVKLVLALVAISTAGVAHADDADKPFTIGSKPAWFVLGGTSVGGTVGVDDRGGFIGAELSMVRLDEGTFVGLYADGYYDFGVGAPMVTAGPELGYKLFALDGGVAYRRRDGDNEYGATARVTLGLGVFGIFTRYAYFNDAMDNEHVIQIGALLKLPFYVNR